MRRRNIKVCVYKPESRPYLKLVGLGTILGSTRAIAEVGSLRTHPCRRRHRLHPPTHLPTHHPTQSPRAPASAALPQQTPPSATTTLLGSWSTPSASGRHRNQPKRSDLRHT